MTRNEIQEKFIELSRERNKKAKMIIEEAKQNGTWKSGLDGNRELFADLDKEFKRKVEELKGMLTEE